MCAAPRPISPNGRLMAMPSPKGTATPAIAMRKLARPVFLMSLRLVSSPAENIIRITPIFENTETVSFEPTPPSSTNSALYAPSATPPSPGAPSKPMSVKPQNWPKTAGPMSMPAIMKPSTSGSFSFLNSSPHNFVASSIMAMIIA